ncbi:hypothetical protein [Aliivibrio fischeri]|uniref:Nitroreductase domain-containing protein n=1 Tax=Aliivibrio fischeri TaxID=668 RepID=A0A844NXW5_ALIFS|nr:hypothetical protein [Aliivibrio fischeri]MUK47876.1 hypothetical protein [Aliivibrio fischeri]
MNSNHTPIGNLISFWDFDKCTWSDTKEENIDLIKAEKLGARSAFEYLSEKKEVCSQYKFKYEPTQNSCAYSIVNRHSVRNFDQNKKLSSQLLHELINNINNRLIKCNHFEMFICILNVDGYKSGLYKLNYNGKLSWIKQIDKKVVCDLISGMNTSMTATVTAFLVVDWHKFKKNGGKSYRQIMIESGAIIQKLILDITDNGLFGVPTPAIKDTKTKNYLDISSIYKFPIYSFSFGYK